MRLKILVAVAAVVAVAGCGGASGPVATVSGNVTYNGQPVREGTITFTPKSGKGVVSGGSIVDGKYSVRGVPQGLTVVFVSAGGSEKVGPISSEESHAASQKYKGKQLPGGAVQLSAIPANATGNNAELNASGAEVKMDLDLKSPK